MGTLTGTVTAILPRRVPPLHLNNVQMQPKETGKKKKKPTKPHQNPPKQELLCFQEQRKEGTVPA